MSVAYTAEGVMIQTLNIIRFIQWLRTDDGDKIEEKTKIWWLVVCESSNKKNKKGEVGTREQPFNSLSFHEDRQVA